MPRSLRALPWLALALLAPGAAAHGGFDAGAPFAGGSIHFQILGAPLLAAGAPLEVVLATDVAGPFEVRFVPPGGAPGPWFPLEAQARGHARGVTFPSPGDWRAEVRGAGETASIPFEVWPGGEVFPEAAGAAASRGVLLAGGDEPVEIVLVDRSHAPLAPPADAVAHVEGPEGASVRPLAARDGVLALEGGWTTPGAYRLQVASESLGLGKDERPALDLLVVPPDEAAVYGLEARETPFGPLAVASLALALFARRLTRGPP